MRTEPGGGGSLAKGYQAIKENGFHSRNTRRPMIPESSEKDLTYRIQCERALPSDCQKDDVSPFVILSMSDVLEEVSI